MFWAYKINGLGHPKSKLRGEDGGIHKYQKDYHTYWNIMKESICFKLEFVNR